MIYPETPCIYGRFFLAAKIYRMIRSAIPQCSSFNSLAGYDNVLRSLEGLSIISRSIAVFFGPAWQTLAQHSNSRLTLKALNSLCKIPGDQSFSLVLKSL